MQFQPHTRLLKHKRTKIVATVGPACASAEHIQQMMEKGVNVFRLNMSHGGHAEHQSSYQMIRDVAVSCQKQVAILVDLCGPKIRTGVFKDGAISLTPGEEVIMTMQDVEGEPGLVPSQYKDLARDVAVGQRVFLADGEMELVVKSVEDTKVHCLVVQGGRLGNHQGINLPDSQVSAPSMTEKDYQDAEFALMLGVDFIALSFVRQADDVRTLKMWLRNKGGQAGVIAKIERPEALNEAREIIAEADAIMVARGDLGVELPPEQVPIMQDLLIKEARRQHKPVIVATQVLESMITHARPTRAEATDVFHSVVSSADALMLSGETAVGRYPVQAVEMMSRVVRSTEGYLWQHGAFAMLGAAVQGKQEPLSFGHAVARSTSLLSRDLMVRGIVVFSESGWTTRMVSAERPEAPVLAVSSRNDVCRRMNLGWGVIPVWVDKKETRNHVELARSLVQVYDLAKQGEPVLLVQGFHEDEARNQPSIMVFKV